MNSSSRIAAEPTDGTDGHQPAIRISNWRSLDKNTLKGVFTASLPSGLVFHNLMLHERGGVRWISFPAREWTDLKGEKQFTRLIAFDDRRTADRFRDEVLAAVDAHLAEGVR